MDGHHDVFSKQGFVLPDFVKEFIGYNRPEMSKHRKLDRGNVSCSTLQSLQAHLFDCLQFPYWERESWRAVKPDIEKLAHTILNYTKYLQKNNKRMLLTHASTSPIRQIAMSHFSFSQSVSLLNLPPFQVIYSKDWQLLNCMSTLLLSVKSTVQVTLMPSIILSLL